jgi:hypothetical protein
MNNGEPWLELARVFDEWYRRGNTDDHNKMLVDTYSKIAFPGKFSTRSKCRQCAHRNLGDRHQLDELTA